MANTYTQLYIQLVFAVKSHQSMITEEHRERIERYICGIAENIKCKPVSIYCNPDHLHLLISLHPVIPVADVVRDLKSFSSRFINENGLLKTRFEWQTGYGAFSYSKSHVEQVCRYIAEQSVHHKKKTFKDEYLALLKAFEIEYDEKYVFDWLV